uniref:Uncharacterized protein n=1 Tax=Magallana gigas TaxID=29159 RepID=K1R6X6_MAGGI
MADNTEVDMDPSVEFLYKTMLQRDPRKRRVKPVQKHLIQVDFGGADDSDDSDFELDKHKKARTCILVYGSLPFTRLFHDLWV